MRDNSKQEGKEDNYTVMLVILTFIILNATFLAYRNNDPMTPIFLILSIGLMIGTVLYIFPSIQQGIKLGNA